MDIREGAGFTNVSTTDGGSNAATPRTPKPAWRAVLRAGTYVGHLRELVGTAVCIGLYPLGVLDAGLHAARRHDPVPGDRTTVTTPVLLVHGYGHNRSGWMLVAGQLRQAGFAHVFTMNYNPVARDIPALAEQLARRVEAVREATGAGRVHLVGHSLGGILVRYYVQVLGGARRVHTAITVASPHEGTHAARLGLGPTAAQLRPDSWVVRRLAATARPGPVRWIAYYSNLDAFVQPGTSAMLRHPALRATNILVKDHGHLSILLSRHFAQSVTQQLAAVEGVEGYGAPVATLAVHQETAAPDGTRAVNAP